MNFVQIDRFLIYPAVVVRKPAKTLVQIVLALGKSFAAMDGVSTQEQKGSLVIGNDYVILGKKAILIARGSIHQNILYLISITISLH